MKRLSLLITLVLLTACSSTPSTPASGYNRSSTTAEGSNQNAGALAAAITPTPISTEAPTDTPTPTPTPTALPTTAVSASETPTASATESPNTPDLEILSHKGYTAYEGYYIVGEVQNNTDTPMGSVEVTATFYNKRVGKPQTEVGMVSAFTLIDVIPPKGKAPFKIGPFTDSPVKLYEVKAVTVQGQATESLPQQNLVVTYHDQYYEGQWLVIRGDVKNTGTTEAKFVKAVITLYDTRDRVVGVEYAYTDPDTIPAGGTASFETQTNLWGGFDHSEAQATGQ
jgi:hypothetical protein